MEIYFKILQGKLIPAFDSDRDALNNLKLNAKEGDVFRFVTDRARSVQQLKMYHSLLGYALEHSTLSDFYASKHDLDMALRQGYCELNPEAYRKVVLLNGESRMVLPSIALSEMSNEAFNKYMDWCINLLATRIDIEVWKRERKL